MFTFADKPQGQLIIQESDDYLERLSSFERSIKTESIQPISQKEYAKHLKGCVLDWSNEDKELLAPVLKCVSDFMTEKNIYIPQKIILIKTDGRDEWNSAYTRGSSIFLPPKKLAYAPHKLVRLLVHEVFHVIFRLRKEVQKLLFNLIGFHMTNEIAMPQCLKGRKLTNPDGPPINSRFEFMHNGELISAATAILLKQECSTVNSTKDILASISIKMMVVEEKGGRWQPKLIDKQPTLIEPRCITELIERVGSDFAASPDPNEILAEAFVKMIFNDEDDNIDLSQFNLILHKVI